MIHLMHKDAQRMTGINHLRVDVLSTGSHHTSSTVGIVCGPNIHIETTSKCSKGCSVMSNTSSVLLRQRSVVIKKPSRKQAYKHGEKDALMSHVGNYANTT